MGTSSHTNSNNDKIASASPEKKVGRRILTGVKLPFSPKVKSPSINKVFVVGAQLGLILIRTERQKIKNDAFTNDAIRMIEDEESDVANRLNIIKICTRRQSQMIDKSLLQSTGYASLWFVAVTEEENNTESFRRNHADKLITFLNSLEWKFPQTFTFAEDETKLSNDKIIGTWDMYLLNMDIATILKTYVYEGNPKHFLEDAEAIAAVFGNTCTKDQAKQYLATHWWNSIH